MNSRAGSREAQLFENQVDFVTDQAHM